METMRKGLGTGDGSGRVGSVCGKMGQWKTEFGGRSVVGGGGVEMCVKSVLLC